MTEKKELWGGAITTQLPRGLLDASDFRQVPDTQEVFLPGMDATETTPETLQTNDSLIFDLMERIDGDDLEAIKEHFTEISTLNGASNWELFRITKGENELGAQSYVCVALEPALKWGKSESEDPEHKPALAVVLGIVRLAKVHTDLLVTYNAHFSDIQELEALEFLHHVQDEDQIAKNIAYERIVHASSVVEGVINNMKVEDWGLFG
jgi:hypothetical protein